MADPRFFAKAGPFSLAQLAAETGSEFSGDGARLIDDVAALPDATPTQISYFEGRRNLANLAATRAGAVCVTSEVAATIPATAAALITPTPHLTFVRMAELFYPVSDQALIHASAVIDPAAQIGKNCRIGACAVIGAGVVIGDHCTIAANVTISHSLVGSHVVILPGARLGQEGFGFVTDPATGLHRQVPQLGRVVVGDHVVIGANVTIDRGALGDTMIRRGAIIDNLVQIAHNCDIGEGAILVAQSGIAGSARMEKFSVLAAQSGVADHLTIGEFAQIGAKSGIMRDVPAREKILGMPGLPVKEFFRQQTALAKLVKNGK